MISRSVRSLAFALSLGVGIAGAATPSSAQLWNWGGSEEVASSGKESIRFNPSFKKGEVIVSFSDRRLYLITAPGQALSYPIAIPREQSRWQGVMTITDKRVNPSWTPTPEMRKENPKLPSWVPGGHPMNPLGVRGLYLGTSTYRIHGTDAPWTIGQPVSKGCIRMYNQDVIDLYDRVPTGTKVTVTWQAFMGGNRQPQPVLQVASASYDDDLTTDQPRRRTKTTVASTSADDDRPTDQPRRKAKATAESDDDRPTDQPKRKIRPASAPSDEDRPADQPKRKTKTSEASDEERPAETTKAPAKPRRVSETAKRAPVAETSSIEY